MAKKKFRREQAKARAKSRRAADRAEAATHREAGIVVDEYEGIELENEGIGVSLEALQEVMEKAEDGPPPAPPEDPFGGYHWLQGANGEPVLVNGRDQFVGYWKDFDPPEVKAKRRAAEKEEEERLRCIEVQKMWWAKQPPYWKPTHDLELPRG